MKVVKGLECRFQIWLLFLNSLLFQFKSFMGIREPFKSIPSFIPYDSEIFLLTVHFLKNWFFVRSGTDQINQKYFWNQKKFKKIFDIHLLYHVYIIPRFNG